RLLGAKIRDRALDGVLGQHRAVNLDRGQVQLLHDHAVLDLLRLVDRLALEPFGRERRRRDGRAASERLELGVLDASIVADLDLQAHDVAARRRADESSAYAIVTLVERPDVARVLVMFDDLVAVCHGTRSYFP